MNGYLNPGDEIHIDLIYPNAVAPIGDYYMNVANIYFPEMQVQHVNFNEGDSDHTSFNNHGYMGIYPFEDYQNYSPYIHTVNDLIGQSVNSFAMSQRYCQMNIGCLAEIANRVVDTTAVGETLSVDASVYPNPVEGEVSIQAEGLQKVIVFNQLGQQIAMIETEESKQTLNLSHFPSGVYLLQIITQHGMTTKNIIVK